MNRVEAAVSDLERMAEQLRAMCERVESMYVLLHLPASQLDAEHGDAIEWTDKQRERIRGLMGREI